MKASWEKYMLKFKSPAGTSRGTLLEKDTYFLMLEDGQKKGIGECNLFVNLSIDDTNSYEEKLNWLCKNIQLEQKIIRQELQNYPSILFGWEQALLNLENKPNIYFPSKFTNGEDKILINGLIWMGDFAFIQKQIEEKLQQNFACIKLKIGALAWEDEKRILQKLREKYPAEHLELRVDANGAYSVEEAKKVLEDLQKLKIHSIEQPIKAGDWQKMQDLCKNSPTPIALDEELIGILKIEQKLELVKKINPQYLILKPSLLGGIASCQEWIEIAKQENIGWWITSALESNIGLNAIAQWTYTLASKMPQGLGTGGLFTNNVEAPIFSRGQYLYFKK